MKIKLGKFKQIIKEALLVEAPCTSCGDPNAYVGFNSCECPNPACEFFSTQQAHDTAKKPGYEWLDAQADMNDFQKEFIERMFKSGKITKLQAPQGKKYHYEIGMGDLNAYDEDDNLIAAWNTLVPDCKEDYDEQEDYTGSGTWESADGKVPGTVKAPPPKW